MKILSNAFLISIVIVLLTGFVYSSYGQDPQRKRDFSNMPAEGMISGRVIEKGLQGPVEYANIVLYRTKDSSLVTGTVTGPGGSFKLEKVPYGHFYLTANFIGYEKTWISDIKITPKNKQFTIGEIQLTAASTNIDGVEIIAEKAHVEFRIDKKVINVSQDIMASGASAVGVLENVPSIDVDIEGNVSLRGTSNFQVLIDGRPSVLEGNDALQQTPASIIDRIEIITNPSAKYDPDGVGGILNIILKKQQKPGVNGIVNVSAGSGNKYKADALLNYRSKKINLFVGFDFNERRFTMESNSVNETYRLDTTNYRISDMAGNRDRQGYGIKGGLDYYLTERSTLTISGKYGGYGFERDNTTFRHIYTEPITTNDYSKSLNTLSRDGTYHNLTINYQQLFDDNGHQVEAMVYYSKRISDNWEDQQNFITDAEWNNIDDFPETIQTTEDGTTDEFRIKADYTRPTGEDGLFEAGYQSRLRFENGTYLYQDYDHSTGGWIENDQYSNEMDFKRNIHSVYATYGNQWKFLGYKFGLRGEYTDREIKNVNTEYAFVINRFDYFPSMHLSAQLMNDNQVFASYSRRIDRPRGRELDPFPNYMDPYNIRVGNPELEPEYIDSYELGYQKLLNKSFLSLEGYYRINKNKITRIITLLEDGTFLHTYQNLNKDYSLGMEMMANLSLTKWFMVNASANIFDYRLEGTLEDEDIVKSSTNWSGKLNTTLKFKYDFRVQISGIYRGPSVTVQGEREGYFVTNFALRKDFFEHKFNATLSVRDMFKTAKYESTSSGSDFYSYSTFVREAPVITLNLSYVINNYKKQKGNNGQSRDMEEDMEDDF